MKYIVDHDLHIHSKLSFCSKDKEQNKENILKYAEKRGLKHICVTDHFWDSELIPLWNGETWYGEQNFSHISSILPLPQSKGINFHFGCETEMDKYFKIGIHPSHYDSFDFIIVPTTHLHSPLACGEEDYFSNERKSVLFVERINSVLDSDLPLHKVGIAHLTDYLIGGNNQDNWDNHFKIIDGIKEEDLSKVFSKVKENGCGIEINMDFFRYKTEAEKESVLRPYKIAKKCGCKFYFGSDSHYPSDFENITENHLALVEALSLEETDKFNPFN